MYSILEKSNCYPQERTIAVAMLHEDSVDEHGGNVIKHLMQGNLPCKPDY